MIITKFIRFILLSIWLYYVYAETQSIYLLTWLGVNAIIVESLQYILHKNINLNKEVIQIEKDNVLNAKDLTELVNKQEKRLRRFEQCLNSFNKDLADCFNIVKECKDTIREQKELDIILDKELN